MRFILFIASLPFLIIGLGDYVTAETVFQQLAAEICGLIGVVMFCSAGVIDAVVDSQKQKTKKSKEM